MGQRITPIVVSCGQLRLDLRRPSILLEALLKQLLIVSELSQFGQRTTPVVVGCGIIRIDFRRSPVSLKVLRKKFSPLPVPYSLDKFRHRKYSPSPFVFDFGQGRIV